jgi:hypothetical protein
VCIEHARDAMKNIMLSIFPPAHYQQDNCVFFFEFLKK